MIFSVDREKKIKEPFISLFLSLLERRKKGPLLDALKKYEERL